MIYKKFMVKKKKKILKIKIKKKKINFTKLIIIKQKKIKMIV
jgi:hypothetical protein